MDVTNKNCFRTVHWSLGENSPKIWKWCAKEILEEVYIGQNNTVWEMIKDNQPEEKV